MPVLTLNKSTDERDLERYRELYNSTGDKFFLNGIEYLENGKVREGYDPIHENYGRRDKKYDVLFSLAQNNVKELMKSGYVHEDIPELLGLSYGKANVGDISRGAKRPSFNAIVEFVDKFNKWKYDEVKAKAEAS